MYEFLAKGRTIQTCSSKEEAIKAAIAHGLAGLFMLKVRFPHEKYKTQKKWTLAKFIETYCIF